MKDLKPHVIVTYNGDFFDWPFVDKRAQKHGIDMKKEIGFSKITQNQEENYLSRLLFTNSLTDLKIKCFLILTLFTLINISNNQKLIQLYGETTLT